ncbi:MAG: LuxR C-terminal-related transcriptional regulator [Rhodothermales bacterium]
MIDSSSPKAVHHPLLETRLNPPRWRDGMISRPRLVEALTRGAGRKVTVLAAPAGFGKTSLLAEWLAGTPAAWLSLHPGDNDPTLFWSYVIAALRTRAPQVGLGLASLFDATQSRPINAILTTLLNEVAAFGRDVVLVLDDVHRIDNPAIHDALAFVIAHQPANLRLVLASRAEMPFPTSLLRARGELTELRAGDLQFTPAEAADYLRDAMGLRLTEDQIAALEQRTEGWIAGLQLAALSLQGREDAENFVRTFAGDHRHITDFLVDEVLRHQSEDARRFLLQTCILDQMNGPLCDAVTGATNGSRVLQALEREHLFIVPLDETRRWYRYHHLFADALRTLREQSGAGETPLLHRRASGWYEANGLPAEAIHHALAGGETDRAAGLIERAADPLYARGQSATLYGWLEALPEPTYDRWPVLDFWRGWALLERGDLEAARPCFERAGRAIATEAPPANAQAAALPGRIATARAIDAQASGDVEGTVREARRALTLLPEDDRIWRGGSTVILGLTAWCAGDLDEAYRVIAGGFELARKSGDSTFHLSGAGLMADIRFAQGRLQEALNVYRQALRVAEEGQGAVRGIADLYRGVCDILLELGETEAAAEALSRSESLGPEASLGDYPDRWPAARARRLEIEGQLDAAAALLDDAERAMIRGPVPQPRPYAARKARILIRQGRLEEAWAWADERALSAGEPLSFMREYEHLTFARLLLARDRHAPDRVARDAAGVLLDRLRREAERGGRRGSLVETLLLEAQHARDAGDAPSAQTRFERALALAEGDRPVRLFLDEGAAIGEWLAAAVARGCGGAFGRHLLEALGEAQRSAARAERGGGALPEPLTAREIEILRLIAAGKRNPDIAEQLYISVATVKRHISNAYGKLGVSHRTEAVARATTLGVL